MSGGGVRPFLGKTYQKLFKFLLTYHQNAFLLWVIFRACLKNHSCNLHAPLCGIFCPNSVAVARYGALIRTKSPTNCDVHLAESLFQTRSSMFSLNFWAVCM